MTTPTINHTITVTVAGVDLSAYVMKDSLYCRSSIGNKGDTASFTLRDTTGEIVPLDWDEVVIAVNGTAIFGGYVASRRASGVGAGSNKEARWDIQCRDYSALLDRVVVNRGYADAADVDIIGDLFGTYLPTEFFDDASNTNVVDGDIDIYFENITLREALNRLATTAGAAWHIAADKSIYWYDPVTPGNSAFDIDTVSPNNTSSFDVLSLNYGTDATAIVNRVRVIGGEEVGAKVTDTFEANGEQDTFGPLTQKPGTFAGITYYVTEGMTTEQRFVYPSFIGYEAEGATLSVNGGDYEVIVNQETRFVQITEGDGDLPKNLTNVSVSYYPLVPVDVTVEDVQSQSIYGRVFDQTIQDESLTSTALATDYANRIIDEYAFGRETVSFSVTEHGLMPGTLIGVTAPVFDIDYLNDDALLLESGDTLLLESGDRLMLESTGTGRKFLIQEVSIRAVVTQANQFMVIATVSAGKYIPTLFDSLLEIRQFTGASGPMSPKSTVSSLSRLSGNMGEVVAGRAVFTDGGTAPFSWTNYADHTGAVIGLEDSGSNVYGAMYILDDGTVKAKIGRMDGMGSVGTVVPSGWGIWTNNGYFQGVIAATAGEIGGWTIANNQIFANGGTIATRALPINSSNPGVYLTSAGLFGYGTLGLTFSIPTDPALSPYFSSGTITNTIYEVTTASVLRTGTAGARVQIDNSGIFAYDSGGTARFTVDSSTGRMTASQGTFSGTISAAVFTGGTVTQGAISAAQMTGGTITGALVTGGTVQGGNGTAVLDANGLHFEAVNGASLIDQASVRWQRSGTTAIKYGARYDGSFDYSEEFVGVASTKNGRKEIHCYGTATETYSLQVPTAFSWWQIVGGTISQMFGVGTADIQAHKSVVPYGGTALTLGTVGQPFRYLYLYSPDGNDWRVEVSNAGALTVTSV